MENTDLNCELIVHELYGCLFLRIFKTISPESPCGNLNTDTDKLRSISITHCRYSFITVLQP